MSIKRNELLKHLERHGCVLHRHGSKHDLYANTQNNRRTTVPRHQRMDRSLCEVICRQLGVEKI
ncbi:type II toxin-antitoxin system HicA family toxin [Dyadobacter soli]|uniref:type II toxin-antitoxin system HicA family toxin n=1 Tax=Dyadobacter soli TaxID=659014 RepID=UPI001E35C53B|nr:type II toxin-antitoxin system HicA family toxin [Dyadobacter soli]